MYRLGKSDLWVILESWDEFFRKKVRLVACGGTALTIQDIKPSTKDVDFVVPDFKEYDTLIRTIERIGYRQKTGAGWSRRDQFIFDLFRGDQVYSTGLIESPLIEGNHIPIKSFKKISVSALNDYDLIITKMIRGTQVDVEDCLALMRIKGANVDIERLRNRYQETAKYTLNPDSVLRNLDIFLERL